MTMFLSKSITEELRGLRQKRGLTLDQTAMRSGVCRLTVFNVEHGKTSPTLETLLLILNGLDARLVIEPLLMPEDLE
jgi:transcriptional regulator with XRE-family HTH domain